jgi:hypothetical protein
VHDIEVGKQSEVLSWLAYSNSITTSGFMICIMLFVAALRGVLRGLLLHHSSAVSRIFCCVAFVCEGLRCSSGSVRSPGIPLNLYTIWRIRSFSPLSRPRSLVPAGVVSQSVMRKW